MCSSVHFFNKYYFPLACHGNYFWHNKNRESLYSWKIDFTQRDRFYNYHLKTVTSDILRLMIKIEICAGSGKKPEPSSMVVSKGKTTVLLKGYALGPKTEG